MVKNEKGFTLVELIVAVTVFTWALLALLGANMLVIQLLGAGDRASTASFYARERMETLRGLSCGVLKDSSETRGDIYDLSWDVEDAYAGSARRVQLLVSYPSLPGATRTDTVESLVLCVR
ncbi:MAG: prepilin-type N-terminal cleavage/methylation domain-containing protein [Gemmatimonadales bacterium]|nr:prepilin-type N-terminal cleavage/methylation domain-containing protein [Gemmatimonadales bacterium]NIN12356.1 prepilin-type N-terminal cleavage/methylation domain-containing protein [Gemmatimonadales bacterium]NIN48894.1 prepilin-type N-terminal cleavage/methylation domain-containing protein [Gemmatimonadales bacterium]NIP06358.1 prepilin-type N-terminal cleavage/methylation domain-containing protein [Gemmatimonadales bacterium]NIR00731.1 prepilin-type N-terminal cleavage/methylation domain